MGVDPRISDAVGDYEEQLAEYENASVTDRMRGETKAFEELTEKLATVYADDPEAQPNLGVVAKSISDISNTVTKTDAKESITSSAQQKRAVENGTERTPLDTWIRENLEEVRITQTTDHIDETTFAWDFGGVTVETESGGERRGHYSWINFRDLIDESGGPYLGDPNPQLRDSNDWRDFIVRQREENETVRTFTGERTMAVQHLQNTIRRLDAFESLEATLNYGGVHAEVNNDPPEGAEPVDTDTAPQRLPEWRVDKLLIPNDLPADAVEETNTTVRGLQIELDARGYTLPGLSKISQKKYVAGQQQRFWVLTGDFATPNRYQPAGEEKTATDMGQTQAGADEEEIGGVGGL